MLEKYKENLVPRSVDQTWTPSPHLHIEAVSEGLEATSQ